MKLPVGGGSKPSVPPGWAPRAASEISPGGLRARPPDQSPLGAASAVMEAPPHSRPQRLRTKTRGPCVPQRGSVPGWGAVPSPAVTRPPVTPARPALLSLTPALAPGAAGGPGILQDGLLQPLPLRAYLLLPEGAQQDGGGEGCGERGVGSWGEGSQGGGDTWGRECGVTGGGGSG